MPKQFKKVACFLTVLGLLSSFSISTTNIYAEPTQNSTQSAMKVLSNSIGKKQRLLRIQDSSDLDKLLLNIDWGFDFDDYYEDSEQGGFYYVINNKNQAIITSYGQDSTKIAIPSTLGGYPVKMIYYNAFSSLNELQSVTIPQGVEVIGSGAFSDCSSLKTVNIPSSVKTIDTMAFAMNTSLTSITIPNSVTKLGSGVLFLNTSLTSVSLPSSLTSIPSSTFAGCKSLKSISLPSGINSIGESAFAMTGFTEFTVPNGVTNIGKEAFSTCEKLTKITIPKSVITIGKSILDAGAEVVTIYGETGSYAQTYAKENDIAFKSTNSTTGDVIATGVTTENLNVRSGSAATYTKLGTLTKGSKVEVVQKLSNGWYKIKYNSSYGYVLGTYVKLDAQKPDDGSQDQKPSEEKVIATGVTTENLNVRRGSGATYERLGTLVKGSKVEIVEKLSNGWYKIKYNNSYGYVSGTYVKLDTQKPDDGSQDQKPDDGNQDQKPSEEKIIATGVTTENLNVRSGSAASYTRLGTLLKGSKVEIVEKLSNGWYKIKYNSTYGYVSGTYVKLDTQKPDDGSQDQKPDDGNQDQKPTGDVIATGVTTENLNVRKGSGATYTRLGTLVKGSKVEIVEKLSNGWYKIKYNSTYGYVSGTYVKLDAQTPDSGSQNPKPSGDKVIATGITTGNLNVRSGSAASYTRLGTLVNGSRVEIVEKLSNGWYKIKYNNSYGYVSGTYVKLI
ncbi:SH3 domain-containing protein [Intestinibacter sp.]